MNVWTREPLKEDVKIVFKLYVLIYFSWKSNLFSLSDSGSSWLTRLNKYNFFYEWLHWVRQQNADCDTNNIELMTKLLGL